MKLHTREYMAHKADYDALYYASPISDDPAHIILRRRTRHAGNQPGARQCDYNTFIVRTAAAIVHGDPDLHDQYFYDWMNHQRRRRRARRNPDTYPIGRKQYRCSTLTLYVRARLREQYPYEQFDPATTRYTPPLPRFVPVD